LDGCLPCSAVRRRREMFNAVKLGAGASSPRRDTQPLRNLCMRYSLPASRGDIPAKVETPCDPALVAYPAAIGSGSTPKLRDPVNAAHNPNAGGRVPSSPANLRNVFQRALDWLDKYL